MADLTFDQLPAATSTDGSETLPIMQGGVTKRTTLGPAGINLLATSEAAMLSSAATIGSVCLRQDVGPAPGTLFKCVALPATLSSSWIPTFWGDQSFIPQANVKTPKAMWREMSVSATGCVIQGPIVFGGLRCITGVSIAALYDNTTATGTNLMPALVTAANSFYSLLDKPSFDRGEGVQFDTGLYITVGSGTYVAYVRDASSPINIDANLPVVWNKYIITADGVPPGLEGHSLVNSIYCCVTGTIAGLFTGGAATGPNRLPGYAPAANAVLGLGPPGGATYLWGVFVDWTSGMYVLTASPIGVN